MKTISASVLSLLFLGACATAPPQEAVNELAPRATPAPALFVARDADSTMYLFGTIHIRRAGEPWGGPQAQAGLAAAEEVWTELMMTPETDAQAQALALQYGAAEAGRPLSSWLQPEENARLAAVAQGFGLDVRMLEAMRPWLVSVTLEIVPMMMAGYDPQQGADRLIDAFADANGKTPRAFETAEEQIQMLAGFPEHVQRQMLLEAIERAEKGSREIDGLAQAWQTGDLIALERLVIDEMRTEYPEFYNVLLVERNNAWMEVLAAEMEGSGVDFVAVGAGHMLGEHGLIAQLRARGYTVERVE